MLISDIFMLFHVEQPIICRFHAISDVLYVPTVLLRLGCHGHDVTLECPNSPITTSMRCFT